ncbi:MAG: TlpA disulfide reductase family protein [Desulfomonilaceae bacterium]
MKLLNYSLALAASFVFVIPGLAAAPDSITLDARVLADIRLATPKSAAAKKYLGLGDAASFTIPQIKADTVIIEIFNMYCPICQAEAPSVNALYRLIEKTPRLKKKVKLIGIGVGNSPFEVQVFRKKYNVSFPLLPDQKIAIGKAISGPIKTPTFIAVKTDGRKSLHVYFTHVGKIGPKQLLSAVTAAQSRRQRGSFHGR